MSYESPGLDSVARSVIAEKDARIAELEADAKKFFDLACDADALQDRAEQAEAEAARYRAEIDHFRRKLSVAIEEREKWRRLAERHDDFCACGTCIPGDAVEREPDGYDPLGTERWVDGEPNHVHNFDRVLWGGGLACTGCDAVGPSDG